MFFITNMYEKRFNDNMSRHRLDAKIAPSRPKPSCRLVQNNEIPQKSQPLTNYHLADQMKSEVQVIVQQAPPTYQDSFFGQKSTSTDSQLNILEAQKAPIIGIKPFKRTNSQESGFFTGGDSDAASNFSVSA